MKNLILASASPRRKELLEEYGFEYEIVKSNFTEVTYSSPKKTVLSNALGKAKEVYSRLKNENALVLGADTIVVFNKEILGKPKNEEDAFNMLKKLSGKAHQVITAYAFCYNKKTIVKSVKSKVVFNALTDEFIKEYISSGSPLDKAGAYGVQDNNGVVKKVKGSLNNVIGLPIEIFEKKLKKLLKK